MKVLVTGGNGFLGKSVVKTLQNCGVYEVFSPRSARFDLVNEQKTKDLFDYFKPNIVIHLAAVVGGIGANKENPGSFFYKNIMMGLNVIEHCRLFNVDKIVQIGTVCSYPKFTPVPFSENSMWDGYPEETNAPYGIAKKSLYTMIKAYSDQYNLNGSVLVPCNLYGPYDNFDPKSSHVIPALIKKFVEAKLNNDSTVVCCGTGNATREFIYVDDAAEGIALATEKYNGPDPVNIGSGNEISIKALAEMIARLTGFTGRLVWDASKPNGQPRRGLDVTRARQAFGFQAATSFEEGLRRTIDWFRKSQG